MIFLHLTELLGVGCPKFTFLSLVILADIYHSNSLKKEVVDSQILNPQ